MLMTKLSVKWDKDEIFVVSFDCVEVKTNVFQLFRPVRFSLYHTDGCCDVLQVSKRWKGFPFETASINWFRIKSRRHASSQLQVALVLFGSLLFQEKAITPSESFLFPGTDWLIGNHSDELTPWIPVIAARRVISRHNLTQQLKCQLISSVGNNIMGMWICVCVSVCVCCILVCLCVIFEGVHWVVMLSLDCCLLIWQK